MIIKKLELSSFGKFDNYKLEFKDGINLIYGENESGKSTLHSFIDGIFYGFLKPFTKKTIYLDEHENYNPINSNLYRGNLEFEIEGVVYRIERDFKRKNENTRIYEKSTGDDITYLASDLSAGKVIQPGIYFFGLSDLVFKNTVFISQQGIYTDDKLADEVRDRLVNVVTTKDENISVNKAIDSLDQEFKEIGTERAYTSKYGILVKKLSDKKMELKEVEHKRSFYNELIENAENIDKKRESLRVEILKKEDLLERINLNKILKKYNEALELEKEIKRLDQEKFSLVAYKDIVVDDYSKAEYLNNDNIKLWNQIQETKSEIEKIESEINCIIIPNDSEIKSIDSVINDDFRVRYIEEKVGNSSISELDKKVKRHEKSIKSINLLAGLMSALYLFLVLYFISTNNYILLTGIQSILLVIVILFYKSKLNRDSLKLLNNNKDLTKDILDIISKYGLLSIKDFHQKVELAKNKKEEANSNKASLIKLNDRIGIRKDSLRKLEKALLDNKDALNEMLDINKQKGLEDFKKSKFGKLRFDEVQKELLNSNKELNKLLQGKTIADFKIDKDIKDIGIDLETLDEEKIIDNSNSLKSDLEKLSLDYRGCEVQIQNLEGEISKEASLNEEILALESRIEHLDKKKSSIEYAIIRIKELSTDIHRDYAPIINKKVGQLVNKITDGKYNSVRIDKNLNVSLQSKDEDRLINFNKLSAGTIDQIYFSLRMGLAEEIIHKNLPLIFDECFAQYDDVRLGSILKFLVHKGQNRQIIIFTCHNREKTILDGLGIEYNYIDLQN